MTERTQLETLAANLWQHMEWDLIEDDSIYAKQGHTEELAQAITAYNEVADKEGANRVGILGERIYIVENVHTR